MSADTFIMFKTSHSCTRGSAVSVLVETVLIGVAITGCVRAVGKELYNVDITSEVLDVSTETMADITQEHVTFKLQIFPLNPDGMVVAVNKKNHSQVQTSFLSGQDIGTFIT